MKNRRNYYRIVHVQPDAPKEIIRSSYRTLMQKMRMHPDLGGDDQDAAELNEAYHTLTDPRHRAAYDKARLDQAPPNIEGKTESNIVQHDARGKIAAAKLACNSSVCVSDKPGPRSFKSESEGFDPGLSAWVLLAKESKKLRNNRRNFFFRDTEE